jgi:hypothetical protein
MADSIVQWNTFSVSQLRSFYGFRQLVVINSFLLTLILLMWNIGWAPNNVSKWQIMRFNSAFKGLTDFSAPLPCRPNHTLIYVPMRVKGIGYPLHWPVSPSLPLPCVTVCHHVSTGLYSLDFLISNFRRVLYVVRFLLGNSPASEFYMPTFRNTLFHLHR